MARAGTPRRHAAMQRLLNKAAEGQLSGDECARARRMIREETRRRVPWKRVEQRRWLLGQRLAGELAAALERLKGAA